MSENDIQFEELQERWESFISKFHAIAPKTHVRENNVFSKMVSVTKPREKFVEMARETRPFLTKELWSLLETFMDFMKNLPNPEGANYQAVYEGMTPAGLIKRLLTKRPIVFFKKSDDHVLRNEPLKFQRGRFKWDSVAKTLDKEKDDWPYLREYISYDEMLLSACVSMSTPTFFLSDGSKKRGSNKLPRPFIPEGILCGLVGARLQKEDFMEHRFLFPRNSSNKKFTDVHKSDLFWIQNVYSDAFPEGKISSVFEIKSNSSVYEEIYVDGINVAFLKKRLALSVIPLIEEAIHRGFEKNRKVVASVPPIGAGLWRGIVKAKTIVSLIATGVLEYLDNNFDVVKLSLLSAIYLPVVDFDVYFDFTPKNQILSLKVERKTKSIEIKFKGVKDKSLTIFNEFRYVAQLLPSKFSSCLVVAGYAWDGNSYPGNEYWKDSTGSFDSQSILCSCLGQFQNPEVNVKLADAERIKFY